MAGHPWSRLPAMAVALAIGLALLASLLGGCASRLPERSEAMSAGADVAAPIVIAHRGASGHRPEHTLAAYELAIAMGADFIEPDLVVTKDGVLIARHENELAESTDVASRAEFAARRTSKRIDGVEVMGWFAEDFTLAEIKRLRAREPLPALRPDSARFDGEFEIPTFAEVIALAKRHPTVGIYPETKHPAFFESEGRHLDGAAIAIDTSALLIDTLVAEGFTDPERVFIQSFEVANLLRLKHCLMPAAGVELPLVQLLGNTAAPAGLADASFDAPYDRVVAARGEPGLSPRCAGADAALAQAPTPIARYADLTRPSMLAWMRRHYATGIGPWIANLVPRAPLGAADPRANAPQVVLTGEPNRLIEMARAAGLEVHPYTLRAEPRFLTLDRDGAVIGAEAAAVDLFEHGATGFFIDQPDVGVAARAAWRQRAERAP